MKRKNTSKKALVNIIVIGLFAALSYLAVWILHIPLGPMFVHLGNMMVVLAALLFGGWQAGLAGAIGMGLFDLFNGWAATAPKTFLLKLVIGLIVGLIFAKTKNKKSFPVKPLCFAAVALIAVGVAAALAGPGAFPEKMQGLPYRILITLLCVLGAVFLLAAFFSKLIQAKTAYALLAALCGTTVNLLGETAFKFAEYWMAGSNPKAAFVAALAAQGSTLINIVLSVALGVALYLPLEKALHRTPLGQYYS